MPATDPPPPPEVCWEAITTLERDYCRACVADRQAQRPARARHGIRHLWWWRRVVTGELTPRGGWAWYVPEWACRPVWALKCRAGAHGYWCRGRGGHYAGE